MYGNPLGQAVLGRLFGYLFAYMDVGKGREQDAEASAVGKVPHPPV